MSAAAASSSGDFEERPAYPKARRDSIVDVIHGQQVADPYRWLEERPSEQTQEWLNAERELFESCRGDWDTIPHWRDRIEAFLGSGFVSPPTWRGKRRFMMRRRPGQDHAVLVLREADGSESELVNPNTLDPEGLTTLDSWAPSKEGDRLAYQLSFGGNEESAIFVMEVATREQIEGPIARTRYSPIGWLPGGEAYYYVRRLPADQVPRDEQQYHRRVWFHEVGADPDDDVMIFGADRKHTEYFGAGVSRDGRWLAITASEGTAPRNDLWLADLHSCRPEAPVLIPIQVGVDGNTSMSFGRDGRIYVYTDRDAQRGRLCVTDPEHLDFEDWRDLIPEDHGAVFEGFAILDGPELARPIMLVSWTRHAVAEISIHDLQSGERIGSIDLPGLGTVGGIVERPEGGYEAWFTYTDHTTVPRVMRYDGLTGELSVDEYPPGFVRVPDISSTMHVYRSKDNTEVHVMVLAPLGPNGEPAEPNQKRPTVLYGYGGFGVPMAPGYSPSVLAWVEAGGVYAIACLRGGSEEGEWWHRDGMLAKKQNVFDDFISGAEWLIEQGWTDPNQLVISGGSNGGLLVGAAMVQRPELFAGVHCSAPLLDMIRYERFGLGETWNVEYGSAEDAEQFGWLQAYSPYHHVEEGVNYPAALFTVFDRDTRVDPLHARKMCAALQHATSSNRPILIRAEADVGHGARSVSRSLGLSADVLGFMAAATGLETNRPNK